MVRDRRRHVIIVRELGLKHQVRVAQQTHVRTSVSIRLNHA